MDRRDRRWTLAAWTFLGIGQLLGAHWAYVEVGWGGYYAWDPVENAALMPWLRSDGVPALGDDPGEARDAEGLERGPRRGRVRAGPLRTFLTRSGIVSSIHSFTESSIGAWFLGFIVLVLAGSIYLVLSRLPLLRAKTRLESLVFREATFLYNNLLLVALCLTILWGVVFPILSEAVRGEQITVGAPYYNFFLVVFGLPLLLLMGIGPLIAWRRASLRSCKSFIWPAMAALVAGVILLARCRLLAGRSHRVHLCGLRARLDRLRVRAGDTGAAALSGGSWLSRSAAWSLATARYGGYVVHASIVLLAIGVAGRARTTPSASRS